jgi:hypothetical protein
MTYLVFDKANGLDEYRHHLDIQATLNKYPDKYKLLTCLELHRPKRKMRQKRNYDLYIL